MNKAKYEGVVGSYSFIMIDEEDIIEVWKDFADEHPESFIYLKKGAVKSEKDFHYEISDWYLKNVG